MTENVIETSGLTRRYQTLVAVDGLDLHVPKGCVYGFLGPNGAGKTTTIRMLLGLITPSAGTVQLFGHNMADRAERFGLLRRVGALVEMPALYPHLNAIENLEVTRAMVGAARSQIDRVLTLVNLQDAAKRPVKGYSLGMKQRLGLALAMLNEPEMLILDEPTNGLDPAGIHEMRDLVVRLPKEQGITVFLSSHLLSEVEQMATHVGIVNHGRLLYQGTLDALHAQRESCVTLCAQPIEQAEQILIAANWRVKREADGLTVAAHSDADASLINATLVHGGVAVYRLGVQRLSLEDVFLQMTANQKLSEKR
jgi:ABC-2 type transport system ATP-binding protein